MRIYILSIAAFMALFLGAGTPRAAADSVAIGTVNDVIARFHFIGTKQLEADPKAVDLNKILTNAASVTLRDKTLDKLATTPFRLLKTKLANGNTNDYSELIRPLLEDLLQFETYAELRGPTNEVPELMLAVHVDAARAALWQSNLSIVLTNWTALPVKEISGDGFKGWELQKDKDPNMVRCLRAGDWILFGWGWNDLRLQPGFLQRIKSTGRPVEAAKKDFLTAWLDLPAIAPYHPMAWAASFPYKLPKMDLTVSIRDTKRGHEVRPQLVMQFPEPLKLKLDPWQFPTEIIHNPMVSFTAVRGIAPWLAELETVKQVHPSQVPNQLCIWAMADIPFETDIAMPVQNSSNFLAELMPSLLPPLNNYLAHRALVTEAVWAGNRLGIPQMPFIIPSLQAIHEPSGDYLLASLFPPHPRKNTSPLPKELTREINSKSKLVYYDWELNEQRIFQWHQLLQINLMTSGKPVPAANLSAQAWLTTVRTNLGNCGTEIVLTGPKELTLIRNAPIGFTGFELNMLSYWLDAPNFPLDAYYPPRKPRSSAQP